MHLKCPFSSESGEQDPQIRRQMSLGTYTVLHISKQVLFGASKLLLKYMHLKSPSWKRIVLSLVQLDLHLLSFCLKNALLTMHWIFYWQFNTKYLPNSLILLLSHCSRIDRYGNLISQAFFTSAHSCKKNWNLTWEFWNFVYFENSWFYMYQDVNCLAILMDLLSPFY